MRNEREVRVRRKIRWFRVTLLLFVFMAIVTCLSGAALYAYLEFSNMPSSGGAAAGNKKAPDTFKQRINVLLVGIDDGDVENPSDHTKRADTIIVASINPVDSTINLLSIPRDTQVNIPGREGYDKIGHAFAYGGAPFTARTVTENFGIPINYQVTINWQAFIDVINVVGGVDLYVEHNMDYEDPYANLSIHLTQGYQHLDGQKAGEYVRFRHDELGDIGRVQRQQRFLKALSGELLQVSTVFKLPSLVSVLNEYVDTDMTAFNMLKLANTLKGFRSDSLRTEMLPGNFATIGGASYWVSDKEQTRLLVERLFIVNTIKKSGLPGNTAYPG